jgi:ABC-2 type transport system permease protein
VNAWIACWNIFAKDVRTYYLKPPNLSWGILFPLAWTLMYFIQSDTDTNVRTLLPGVIGLSILFGTTSMLAVTITFEKKGRSFERLLLAPISFELLLLSKTCGAVLFGIGNACVPLGMAACLTDLSGVVWWQLAVAVFLIAINSAFLGLLVAVLVREVFEAQTLANLFRFPMLFLCGLFFPVERLPVWLRPAAFALPLTYGADLLHDAVGARSFFTPWWNIAALTGFAACLFLISLRMAQRRWVQ